MNDSIPRIAVVDDSAFFRSQVKKLLRSIYDEVDIVEFTDGQQAFAALPNDTFDFVTLDVVMPHMTGIQLLEALRLHHPDFNTPILVISADIQESTRKACAAAGAAGFIDKPFKREAVIAILDQLGI